MSDYGIVVNEQERSDIIASLRISLYNYETVSLFGCKDFDPIIARLRSLLDMVERVIPDGS